MPARPSRTNPKTSKTIGASSTQSRQKAEKAVQRTEDSAGDDGIPRAADGYPLTMIEISAAELVPTGQFANVSVGPARIRHWVDARDEDPIPEETGQNLARALNQLAEIVEVDVIAVQRNLVMENLQDQVSEDTK